MSSFRRSSHDSESPLMSSSSSNKREKKKKKSGFASAALRGLGCASSASSEAYAPPPSASASASAVRSSADSQDQHQGRRSSRGRTRPPPTHHHSRKTNSRNNNQRAAMAAAAAVDVAYEDDDEDYDDEDSFDCFMGRHHPMIMHHRTGRYDAERFHREMMKLQTRMSGGLLMYDRYRDLHLDVDRMSYEELLELGDRIGHVSTGLREDEISQSLMKMKHSVFDSSPPDISTEMERKCSICQEEYKVDDDMGKLECGHSYHMYCIKQWLFQKNSCPVCKTSVTKT